LTRDGLFTATEDPSKEPAGIGSGRGRHDCARYNNGAM
jgi:hypothetical protein